MKKRTAPTAIISIILLSLAAGMQVVEVANANPIRLSWVPTVPDTNLPQITIESPQNKTYNSSEMTVNFTVVLPESWFNNDPTGQAPSGHYCNGKILSAQIVIDDNLSHNISLDNDSYLPYNSESLIDKSLILTANLTISEGKHVLTVNVSAASYYSPTGNLTIVRYPISAYSVPVSFYVDTSPFSNSSRNPSPSPTLIPSPSPMKSLTQQFNNRAYSNTKQCPRKLYFNSNHHWLGNSGNCYCGCTGLL